MNQVDILLGTYNGATFLPEQIDSILKQSFTDWKLIIRDDGSSDGTTEILLNYQSRYPQKIILLENDNQNIGVVSNFSQLLETSTAPYIMFCDQDDIWLPKKVALTLNEMLRLEKSNPNIPLLVHTDLKVVDTNLDTLSDSYWSYQGINPDYNTLNRLLIQNVITGCTIMVNKQLAHLSLPIPKKVVMHDWWLGLVASSFGQIHHLRIPTVLYRQHNSNDTGATPFNLDTVLTQFQNLHNLNLHKYILQAKPLLSRYKTKLDTEQKDLLEAFIAIKTQSWLKSKFTLVKYKILKQDIFRNLGLMFSKNK